MLRLSTTILAHLLYFCDLELGLIMATIRPLNPSQERKLVDFLEDRFLQLTRNFKKR